MDPEALAYVLRELLARGLEPPLTCATIGANGSVILFRYVVSGDGLEAKMLAEHIEGGGFESPIDMLFVDSQGEAARVTLQPESVIYS